MLTTAVLILLTLLALAAWALSLRSLVPAAAPPAGAATASQALPTAQALVLAITLGAAALFLYRWLAEHGSWQPVSAHVDGLLLIAALIGALVLYVQARPGVTGFAAFALPVLALMLAWAICAAQFTYRPFNLSTLHPLWQVLHLAAVYTGTALAAVAAMAGAMYLYLQRRLKRKHPPAAPLASLEAVETLIVRTATLGFALLTLGLVAGAVILADEPADLASPAYAVKLTLAGLAWLAYALVMNVRHTSSFRGSRAAWLAIAGLVLLLAIYALVTAAGAGGSHDDPMVTKEARRGAWVDAIWIRDAHTRGHLKTAAVGVPRLVPKGKPCVGHASHGLPLRGQAVAHKSEIRNPKSEIVPPEVL